METLEIEDLNLVIMAIDELRIELYTSLKEEESLNKSRAIIEQIIKDREFERDQTTLNKF